MKTHYSISRNTPFHVSLCGRFAATTTRNKLRVTCKDCIKLLSDKRASVQEFVGRD